MNREALRLAFRRGVAVGGGVLILVHALETAILGIDRYVALIRDTWVDTWSVDDISLFVLFGAGVVFLSYSQWRAEARA